MRPSLAWLLVALAGCSVVVDIPAALDGGAPPPLGEERRRAIELRPTGLDADVEEVAVAIVLGGDGDFALAAEGDDIAVFDDRGAPLFYEIESTNVADGDLTIWVQVPRVERAGGTKLFLHYGGAAVEPPPAENVWPGLAAVWHLTGEPDWPDSTARDNVVEPEFSSFPVETTGRFGGGAQQFSGGPGENLLVVDPPDGVLDFGPTSSFTTTMWVNITESAGAGDVPLTKGGLTATTEGYGLQLGAGDWSTFVADGGTQLAARFGDESELLGDWHMLATVVDRGADGAGTHCAYLDGEETQCIEIPNTAFFGTLANGRDLQLGVGFAGALDEVRVYSQAVDADRLRLEYDNATGPEFFSIGPPEPVP